MKWDAFVSGPGGEPPAGGLRRVEPDKPSIESDPMTWFENPFADVEIPPEKPFEIGTGKSGPTGPFEGIPGLSEHVLNAFEHFDTTAYENEQNDLDLIKDPVRARTINKEIEAILDRTEITINFSPRMVDFEKDPWIRNLYETGEGGGETDPVIRSEWETNNFGNGLIGLEKYERPKYGSLNLGNKPWGGAFDYGSGVLVLNKENLKDRITLTPNDSSVTYDDSLSTLDNPLSSFIRSKPGLDALGMSRKDVSSNIHNSPYIEAQIWGPLPFNKDTVKEIRLVGSGPKVVSENSRTLIGMAEKHGIPVKWQDEEDYYRQEQ